MRLRRPNALRRVAASVAILASSLAGAAGVVVSTAAPASASAACPSPANSFAGTCYVLYSELLDSSGNLATTIYVGQTVTLSLSSYYLGTNTQAMPSGTHLGLYWGWNSLNKAAGPSTQCPIGQTTCQVSVPVTTQDLGQVLTWQGWGYIGNGASRPWICSAVVTSTAETGTTQVAPPTVSIQATPTSLQVNNWTTVVATGHNVPPGGNINLWSYPNSSFTNGTKLGQIDNISASAATFQLPKDDIRQTPQTVWYRATVTGPVNAPTYANVSVTWTAPNPTVTVSANPTSLSTGQSTTVTASATYVPTTSNLNVFEYPYQGDPNGAWVASCQGNGAASETCSGTDTSANATTHYYQAFISGLAQSNWAQATWTAPAQSSGAVFITASSQNPTVGQPVTLTASYSGTDGAIAMYICSVTNRFGGGYFEQSGQYPAVPIPSYSTTSGSETYQSPGSETFMAYLSTTYGNQGTGCPTFGSNWDHAVAWAQVTVTWSSGSSFCSSCGGSPPPVNNPSPTPPPPVNGTISLSANPTQLGRPCRIQNPGPSTQPGYNVFQCVPSVGGYPQRTTTLTASATYAQNGGSGPTGGSTVTFTITGIAATNRITGAPWTGPLSQVEQWGQGTTVGSCQLPAGGLGGSCSITVPYLPYEGTIQHVTFQAASSGAQSNTQAVQWNGDLLYYS